MKKVGIMTLHIGDNYGALLQCYALRHILNTLPDVQAEIINFDPGREFPVYADKEVQRKYLYKLKKFQKFNKNYNGVSDESFKDMNDPSVMQYDYYITGSDQVWNTSFVFANKAYFLDFVPAHAKKIAYAPSIGIPVSSPKLRKEWFQTYIPSFEHLSLREMSYEKFINQFTNKKVYSVVDPTLLLTVEDYNLLCDKMDYPDGDYLVLYFLKHDNSAPLLIDFANMLSRKFDLKVIYSFAKVPNAVFKAESDTFYYSDPSEFVQLIRHAKLVVTNSFHGTIFSILYHVPFYTYLVESMASRIKDLLDSVGLEDRIVYGYKRLTDDMLEVDFEKVDSILAEKRKYSIDFLKNALDIGENML